MKKSLATLLLALTAFSSSALAQNVPMKGGTVSIGDSVEKLLEVAGKPDQKIPLPSKNGGPAYERYDYQLNGRLVIVTVSNGKITGIAQNFITQK